MKTQKALNVFGDKLKKSTGEKDMFYDIHYI